MKTRKEKREEEQRIIREMEEALAPNGQTDSIPQDKTASTNEQKRFCRRCRAEIFSEKCHVCGYKEYVPMDEKKQKKIRLIVGGVCIAVFIVYLLIRLL